VCVQLEREISKHETKLNIRIRETYLARNIGYGDYFCGFLSAHTFGGSLFFRFGVRDDVGTGIEEAAMSLPD